MDKINTYMINKVFTVPYIDKMIDTSIAPDSFLKCIQRYVNGESMTYGEAISEIYHFMDCEYRNEYFFKNTILNQLLIKKHDVYSTAALTELPIGESKADFIMINGRGIVYEIKTDLDNMSRLENQIKDYYKVFSYVYVVVGQKQAKKIREYLQEQKVGIYELTKKGKLIQRKQAYCNRDCLSYEAMFQVLRKAEFEEILLKFYKKLPEVNSFQYYRECLKWLKEINIIALQKEVMKCLKGRTLLTVENKIEESVPYELRYYAYFSKKYHIDYNELESFLCKKVEG